VNLIDRIYQVFAAADQLNLDEWIVYFTKEAQFRFGNTAPVAGHEKIVRQWRSSSTIQTMHHEFVGCMSTMLYCRGRSDIYPLR